ncbi:MAG: GNAT family N-acetyltransferase [Planctomycetia bacterium]|nr:GNAT family N-acetyltransferase [Planctomycetia bacterium]
MTNNILKFKKIIYESEIKLLENLAKEIWEEYFIPIIGAGQVAYMLEKFQSYSAISKNIKFDDYQYYFLLKENQPIGYTGIQIKDQSLFLSKLYIKKEYRGNHFATRTLDFLIHLAQNNGCSVIWLTCNRNNKVTLDIYQKMGFNIIEKKDSDIGNGFFMNDFVLQKPVDS